jgi:lysophospholipase L1-like esterase
MFEVLWIGQGITRRHHGAAWLAAFLALAACTKDEGSHPSAASSALTRSSRPAGPIVAYTGSGARRGASSERGALNIGQQFIVSRDGITVRDLGVWDEGADGLASAHTLTLFSLDRPGSGATATPVASGSLTVPAGTAAPLEDGFRFVSLPSPLRLKPGPYALIAYGMDARDPYGEGGNLPVPATGVQGSTFIPFEFVSAPSPAYPAEGGTGERACVSFRYENGKPPPLRIMPLGDSITFGIGARSAGYRLPLADLLTKAGISFQFVGTLTEGPDRLPPEQAHHDGHRGFMIRAGMPGIDGLYDHARELLGPTGVRPDVILLMIGTNDVRYAYQLESADQRLAELVTLLVDRRTGLAPRARLVLATVTPFRDKARNEKARIFNEGVARVAAQQRAAGNDVVLVDMHGALGPKDLGDDIHPNNPGYRAMARVWFEVLVQ